MLDLKTVDLNLLIVFDALMTARSVTRAGQQLEISQPAMSYALGKLRVAFNDPLFVRVHHEMLPTPRAATLAGPVRAALDLIKRDILQDANFDPAKTRKIFTVCMSDIGEMVFLPPLIRTFARVAPQAVIKSITMEPLRLNRAMEEGEVDLAIGYFPDLKKHGFFQQQLSTSDFVCVARPGNPYLRERLTTSRFLKAPYVAVRAAGRSQELFEKSLAAAGLEPRVSLTVPHFLSLIELVPKTDLIAAVPRVLADLLAATVAVRIHALPIPSPRFAVKQFWHRRLHRDPANRWFRGLVRELFQR